MLTHVVHIVTIVFYRVQTMKFLITTKGAYSDISKEMCGGEECVGILSAPPHSSNCEHVPQAAFRITDINSNNGTDCILTTDLHQT